MSFQRITITGSMRSSLNRLARAARATSSASSSISLIARIRSDEPRRPRSSAEQHRQLVGGADEKRAQRERLLRRHLDAVETEQLGRVLRRVGDVVDGERERDDVVAVVRRDEHGVRQREQRRNDLVGLVLELLHLVLGRA